MEDNQTEDPKENTSKIEFKKPVLIGRIGKLPKKAKSEPEKSIEQKPVDKPPPESSSNDSSNVKSSLPPAVLLKELSTPIPYKEPKWSGLCPDGSEYALEVVKSGMIVERIDLTNKPYYVFGRLANCDIVMAHPTVSRHHAVLQYKAFAAEGEPASGWYLFDLGSTHGTFLNKNRLNPSHYTRVKVGHQIKFGTSTRTYIVLGPDFDSEGESDLTVTEIKQKAQDMKIERDRMIKEAIEQREREKIEQEKKREEQGIDWGMGDDAEEEPDLSENPYACTANEELYLQDPKKTLRGYFEREGHELKYQCDERGPGHFLCRVDLPVDDSRGRPIVAEVMHRGKKKEAVVACALEACRVLDRVGLLRQATHEPKRRRSRDWSADDYYDSDEDSFLDRTGAIEHKRTKRMQKHGVIAKQEEKPLTYDDLVKKVSEIESNITIEEKNLESLRAVGRNSKTNDGEDDLDAFMSSLQQQGQSMAHKADISRTKMTIQKLKMELTKTRRLADIARPAHLPPLVTTNKMAVRQANSVVYGKRIRLKEDAERHKKVRKETKQEETEFVEEVDSDEEQESQEINKTQGNDLQDKNKTQGNDLQDKNEQETSLKETPKIEKQEIKIEEKTKNTRVFGPMRPPDNYIIPENYFDQETDRDLPNIEDTSSM